MPIAGNYILQMEEKIKEMLSILDVEEKLVICHKGFLCMLQFLNNFLEKMR